MDIGKVFASLIIAVIAVAAYEATKGKIEREKWGGWTEIVLPVIPIFIAVMISVNAGMGVSK